MQEKLVKLEVRGHGTRMLKLVFREYGKEKTLRNLGSHKMPAGSVDSVKVGAIFYCLQLAQ